jgi:predicted alpha/beta superfamily hydrolase/TolA-binding protein
MNKNKLCIAVGLTLLLNSWVHPKQCAAQSDGDEITIGTYCMLHSNILNEDRLLYVHLPRGYEHTQLKYPVLYLLYVDIYNYFADAATITEKLGGTGEIPPMIIIGVANTNRYRDLLPVKTSHLPESGEAENHLKFLENELIPFIDNNYRTKEFRILAGPQAAAVFSLYTMITRPTIFPAMIIENPFINPENAAYLYPLSENFFAERDTLENFLYIKCEMNERSADLDYLHKLKKLLNDNEPEGFRYTIEFAEPSGYFVAPLPFEKALRTLFTGHRLPGEFRSENLQDILDYYIDRSEEYGFRVDPPELMLTFEGDKLMQRGKTMEAIEAFEYLLRLYPRSLNALYRLGEAYRGMGNFEKARAYYGAFLEIEDRDAARIKSRYEEMEHIINNSAAYSIQKEIKNYGIKAGLDRYQAIRTNRDNTLYFDENEFNALGYRLMGDGALESAIEVFKMNVDLFPESANVFDSLAEAYMRNGNNKEAIRNYQKSLELNPENENARDMLMQLKKQ